MSDPARAEHPLTIPDAVTIADRRRLTRQLTRVRTAPPARRALLAERWRADARAAVATFATRAASMPLVSYPPELPVSQRRDDLLAAIRNHQVVVVAGETGSGKTTQIPKICLELGRGVAGQIGHTQPRRIAARAVAERIADELAVPLGGPIGYQVRFTDRSAESTLVKVMTDGILLTEIQRDRWLSRYDTIIVDEAHERSLNIDFILGYLKQLLRQRADLKVVVTSATIDPQRFAEHFAAPAPGDPHGPRVPAPIIEVTGRTYPVEIRYRPLLDDDRDVDQIGAIVDAVDELTAPGMPSGDVLVFLSGEREIRDTADALAARRREGLEVLPLFARLSAAEQHRVFAPHTGRRIVLATNVAETSLTVPGIRYVIDPGTARISRYSLRTKVQRLPIEPISQASANQRAGRCGRVADGVCIRLYSQDDYAARPRFTDPEILRTNLASVILQMKALGLGDMAQFPFVEPPDVRNIRDGLALLTELGAITDDEPARLTKTGRALVDIPIDPRLARMVVEAAHLGCLREVLVVASALSIQDPRERPLDHQDASRVAHARFADPTSDFLGYLELWRYLRAQQRALSGSQFRRMCRQEFLSYLRIREWQDLHAQLRSVVSTASLPINSAPASPDVIHQAILAGLLSQCGVRTTNRNEYRGARGVTFAVFPGSALFAKPPEWVMCAELVETSRLWGRVAAAIEPQWLERLAGHLIKRSYSQPHWSMSRGGTVAYEKATLYGIPIVVDRPVDYAAIDPELSREMFIRHALVDGQWHTRHRFFAANRRRLAEAKELEERARRRDIVVDDEVLFDFYDERLPADIVSAAHFDTWWAKERQRRGTLLDFDPAMLVTDAAADVSEQDFPKTWRADGCELPLSYQFEPGTEADGVTVHVPVSLLPMLVADEFDWNVPGLREELIAAIIRALPKPIRRHFVPAPNFAGLVHRELGDGIGEGSLVEAVVRVLARLGGFTISAAEVDTSRIPSHLRVTFQVHGEGDSLRGVHGDRHGRTSGGVEATVARGRGPRGERSSDGQSLGAVLASGTDLDALRRELAHESQQVVSARAAAIEESALTDWPARFADKPIPETYVVRSGGASLTGYPALVAAEAEQTVDLRVLATEADQRRAWPAALRVLLLQAAPILVRTDSLGSRDKLAIAAWSSSSGYSLSMLGADLVVAVADLVIADFETSHGPVRSGTQFAALVEHASTRDREPVLSLSTGPDGTAQASLASPPVAKPAPPQRASSQPSRPAATVAEEHAARLLADAVTVCTLAVDIDRNIGRLSSMSLLAQLADVRQQLDHLAGRGFARRHGGRLADVIRYLRAIRERLDKMPDHAARDRQLQWQVEQVVSAYAEVLASLEPERRLDEDVKAIPWLIEEYRVSLWAQTIGTPMPVSDKRIRRALADLKR